MTAARAAIDGEVRVPMTYEEWLDWAAEGQAEWVDGEGIAFMPPTKRHNRVAGFVYKLLSDYVELRELGEVYAAPYEVRLSPSRSREPDVLFVASANLSRATEPRLEGPPDLVVELVSEESVRRDRVVKREEYAAAGVPEYWIIDCRPGHEREEFLLLDETGRYREAALDDQGRFHSTVVPGFWLDPRWLRQDRLPLALGCLLAIDPTLVRRLLPERGAD